MGRRRKRHKHLPRHMRYSHGAFYYVTTKDGKQTWKLLARDYSAALRLYAEHAAPTTVQMTGTVGDMIERFLRESAPTRARNTQRSYRSWAKPLAAVFGHLPVAAITQRMARQYRDKHPHMVSAQRELTLLKTMLADAVEWGWLDANPMHGFRRKTEPKRKRFITDDEWQRVLTEAGWMRPLLVIAEFTAMRKGDLLRLTWDAVQGNVLRVTTQKTGMAMAYELNADCMAALAELRGPTTPFPKSPLFRSPTRKALGESNLNRYWWALCKRAKIDAVVFHDIRRRRITVLGLQYGQEFAQRWASHADAKTTAGYFAPPEIRVSLPKEAVPQKEAKGLN